MLAMLCCTRDANAGIGESPLKGSGKRRCSCTMWMPMDRMRNGSLIRDRFGDAGSNLPAPTALPLCDPGQREQDPQAGWVGVGPIGTVVMMEDHDGAYYA